MGECEKGDKGAEDRNVLHFDLQTESIQRKGFEWKMYNRRDRYNSGTTM